MLCAVRTRGSGEGYIAVGQSSVSSKDVSAGGHIWRIYFYPRGCDVKDNGEYISIFLKLVSNSNNVSATLEAVVMNRDGMSSSSHAKKVSQSFPPSGIRSYDWGWKQFAKRSDLESLYARNGIVTIMCRVNVEPESLINTPYVPPSDIGSHFGKLLDSTEGFDVSFVISGETFPAH